MSAITLAIVKYTERALSKMHRSAVKTISLMMWALAQTQKPNLSEWARTLRLYRKDAQGNPQPYGFGYKKYRIWRFLTRSVFGAKQIWKAQTEQWLDPRDLPGDRGAVRITLDWTDLGDFAALVIALPYQGRAIPLSMEIVGKEFLERVMTDLEMELVREFLGWVSPELRSRIVILADRGFAKTELFEAIEEVGAFYVIRLRRDGRIRLEGTWRELQELGIRPGESRTYTEVAYTQEHQKVLHVALRRLPTGKANDPQDDVWYLATNWREPGIAPGWYAQRFKIEELFKDLKSQLDVAAHQIKGEEAIARLVAIVGVYYSFVILEGQARTTSQRLRQITRDRRRKPELGIFRQALAVLRLWAAETEAPSLDLLMPIWTQHHRSGCCWNPRAQEAA